MHSAPGTGLETGTGSGVHLEVFGGPQKNKKNVWLGKRREIAKVTFKKTIEGRYRDGVDGYAEVGALLIYWKGENKAFKEEIEELEDVLKNQYHFKTKVFGIPKEHSGTALVQQIAVWAHEFNGPDKLSIIYYGGHAHKDEAQLDNLRIIRDIYDAEHDTSEYGPDPAASFDFEDLTHPLKIPDTDQLLIVDCCFAAKAFSTRELGKRKFELLSSAPPGKEALGPAASTLEINERTKEVESNVHVSDDTIEHRVPIHRVGKLFSYAYYFDSFEFEPTKMKQSRGGFIVHQIKILLSIWVRLAVVLLVIPLRIAELIHKYLE
ncbi:hypothetical protein AOQ84DRAFT_195078 [Neofusicoccum parvum]|uniref:Uncharacterized protein n=1 Tax=Neofusicoccum parvum TaxID=310453 RepID=A0ACB5S1Z5_9PEZI|nr:hypothetical protein AOQ84DRAFT_195078 [Neofusicoccum parvum]GME63162.1 hypothetical protein AOQ84DRAFT_195078 [Neofusicoccum parvum]